MSAFPWDEGHSFCETQAKVRLEVRFVFLSLKMAHNNYPKDF